MGNSQIPRAYTVAEAAEVLRVSAWLVRDLCRSGELRCVRLRNRIIIPAAALEELLAAAPDSEADAT